MVSKLFIRQYLQELLNAGATPKEIVVELFDITSSTSEESIEKISQEPLPDNLEVRITEVLQELGVPRKLRGFQYLREAIKFVYESQEGDIPAITKDVYPGVGKKFSVTPGRVERAIRHAIECCFQRASDEILWKYFGDTINAEKGKATNGELIYMIADRLKMKS